MKQRSCSTEGASHFFFVTNVFSASLRQQIYYLASRIAIVYKYGAAPLQSG